MESSDTFFDSQRVQQSRDLACTFKENKGNIFPENLELYAKQVSSGLDLCIISPELTIRVIGVSILSFPQAFLIYFFIIIVIIITILVGPESWEIHEEQTSPSRIVFHYMKIQKKMRDIITKPLQKEQKSKLDAHNKSLLVTSKVRVLHWIQA